MSVSVGGVGMKGTSVWPLECVLATLTVVGGMISCWRVFADELLHYPMNCRGGTTSAIKGLKRTTLLKRPSKIVSIPLLQFLDRSIPVEAPTWLYWLETINKHLTPKSSCSYSYSYVIHQHQHQRYNHCDYNNYCYNYKTIWNWLEKVFIYDSGLQMHVPMYQKSALASYNCRDSASATISPFAFCCWWKIHFQSWFLRSSSSHQLIQDEGIKKKTTPFFHNKGIVRCR